MALKRFLGNSKNEASILVAASSLLHIRHEYIVGIREICDDPAAHNAAGKEVGLALVVQLAQRGSPLDLLRDPDGREKLRNHCKWLLYLSQAAHGIFYLHSQSILHCNIKLSNMLVTEQLKPLVADFGLAFFAAEGAASYGTSTYMAPELLECGPVTCETDVYAFGLVMWFAACAAEAQEFPTEQWDHRLHDVIMLSVRCGKRPDCAAPVHSRCSGMVLCCRATGHMTCWLRAHTRGSGARRWRVSMRSRRGQTNFAHGRGL